MKNKDLKQLIIWLCLVTGIIVLDFVISSRMASLWNGYAVSFDNVFISLYILWMLVELRTSKRDMIAEGKRSPKKGLDTLFLRQL